MILIIKRRWLTETSTIGELYIDGIKECYTLEDRQRDFPDKIKKQTCIWEGVYKVGIDYSPKYERNMPHILNVPLFEGIRIHSGNDSDDTEGCIILGRIRGEDRVEESVLAIKAFVPKLEVAIARNEVVKLVVYSTDDSGTTKINPPSGELPT